MADDDAKRAAVRLGGSFLPGPLGVLHLALRARWEGMVPNARGAVLVSAGSLTLVFMAACLAAVWWVFKTGYRIRR